MVVVLEGHSHVDTLDAPVERAWADTLLKEFLCCTFMQIHFLFLAFEPGQKEETEAGRPSVV